MTKKVNIPGGNNKTFGGKSQNYELKLQKSEEKMS